MLITIGGNTPEASSGAVMVSPSLTLSWTEPTALLTITLPAVSFTIVSACRIGTPLLIRVPNVRVNREMATLLMTGPTTGILSLNLSQTWRPNLVFLNSTKSTTKTARQPNVIRMLFLIMSLTPMTNRVNAGKSAPSANPAKTSLNFGMTNVISTIRIAEATMRTATG